MKESEKEYYKKKRQGIYGMITLFLLFMIITITFFMLPSIGQTINQLLYYLLLLMATFGWFYTIIIFDEYMKNGERGGEEKLCETSTKKNSSPSKTKNK